MSTPIPQDVKRAVGRRAAELVESGMCVGLGTGSTAKHVVDRLGERIREEGLEIRAVSTSTRTTQQARELGIPLFSLEELAPLDLAIDGADQVDPRGDLIKGLGGALYREKLVAHAAHEFVVIVDASKLVPRLGEGCPVPIEVEPARWQEVARRLAEFDVTARLREDGGRSYVTDNENLIVDAHFAPIDDPADLEQFLNEIPGVVENGLFPALASQILIGEPGWIREWRPPDRPGSDSTGC